jgi:hypothetical protein
MFWTSMKFIAIAEIGAALGALAVIFYWAWQAAHGELEQ